MSRVVEQCSDRGLIQGRISILVSRGRGIGKAPRVSSIVCENFILIFRGI